MKVEKSINSFFLPVNHFVNSSLCRSISDPSKITFCNQYIALLNKHHYRELARAIRTIVTTASGRIISVTIAKQNLHMKQLYIKLPLIYMLLSINDDTTATSQTRPSKVVSSLCDLSSDAVLKFILHR